MRYIFRVCMMFVVCALVVFLPVKSFARNYKCGFVKNESKFSVLINVKVRGENKKIDYEVLPNHTLILPAGTESVEARQADFSTKYQGPPDIKVYEDINRMNNVKNVKSFRDRIKLSKPTGYFDPNLLYRKFSPTTKIPPEACHPEDRVALNKKRFKHENSAVQKEGVEDFVKMKKEEALPVLHEILKTEKERSSRVRAIEALDKIKDSSSVKPLIDALSNDNDKIVRYSAANALGRIKDTTSVNALNKALLEDKNASVRSTIAHILSKIKDKTSVAPLIKALKDDDRWVRQKAAYALGKIKDKKALSSLIEALKDNDRVVRASAAAALGAMKDKEGVGPLIEALNDEAAIVRKEVLKALANIGGEEAIEAIKDASMNDSDPSVRSAAKEALDKLGSKPKEKKPDTKGAMSITPEGNWYVQWVDSPEEGNVYKAALTLKKEWEYRRVKMPLGARQWFYIRINESDWGLSGNDGPNYEGYYGYAKIKPMISEDRHIEIKHPHFILGHWGGSSILEQTHGDEIQGHWSYNDKGGFEIWQRSKPEITHVIFKSDIENEVSYGTGPGRVEMTHNGSWGNEDTMLGNRPGFWIEVYGKNLWGHHIVNIHGQDLRPLEYKVIKDENAKGIPGNIIGIKINLIIYPRCKPGRKTLFVDNLEIPFDFIAKGYPTADLSYEIRFVKKEKDAYVMIGDRLDFYSEPLFVESKYKTRPEEESKDISLKWYSGEGELSGTIRMTLFRTEEDPLLYRNKEAIYIVPPPISDDLLQEPMDEDEEKRKKPDIEA